MVQFVPLQGPVFLLDLLLHEVRVCLLAICVPTASISVSVVIWQFSVNTY